MTSHEQQPPAAGQNEAPGTTAQTPDPSSGGDSNRPRTGAIVWGAFVLVFCAYVTQRILAPATVDSTGWIAATVIGLGVLLLIVGVIVVARNRRRG